MGAPPGYRPSAWVHLLHQLPRADFQLRPVPSVFAPQEQEYQQVGPASRLHNGHLQQRRSTGSGLGPDSRPLWPGDLPKPHAGIRGPSHRQRPCCWWRPWRAWAWA
uniref:Tweety family member 1 n=1 Tax=Homo sapiens TaxID=9606 RepID=A0A0G2JNF5_HUMAN